MGKQVGLVGWGGSQEPKIRFPRPSQGDFYDISPAIVATEVYEPEETEHDTGLFDANGKKLTRKTSRGKLGYI
jgi:hypothetical protein